MPKITLEVIADLLEGLYNGFGTWFTGGGQKTQIVNEAGTTVSTGTMATTAKQDTLLAELEKKADLTETQPVSAASLPLPSGAATSAKQSDGSQKTQLVDAAGDNFEAHTDIDGEKYLGVAMIQAVHADENNSSTTNLTASNGYSFEGDGTSTLGVNAIQVSLFADKNCTVSVQQSPDGDDSAANWDLQDNYNYYANSNFGITVQAISSYVRVVVTTNSLTTTVFRLQTVLCPHANPLPRSLDEDGHLVTATHKIVGDMGKVRISPMGAMKTAQAVRLAGASFTGNSLDTTNYWTSTATDNASATVADGELTLSTGAAESSGDYDASILVNSRRVARYVGGSPNYFRAIVQLPTVSTDSAGDICYRRWGAFDATDGFFFLATQTNPASTPTLSIVSRKSSADTAVDSGSFNGQLGATYTLDTNANTYEIWYSNKTAYFFINDVLLHTLTAPTSPRTSTLNLKVGLQVQNAGGNEDTNTLKIRTATIMRLGNLLTQPTYYYHASGTTTGVNLKVGAGNLHGMTVNNVANNAVITLSDSTSATTPAIFVHTAGATSTAAYSIDFKGIPFSTGLRLTVSAANASLSIFYE